MTRLRSTWRFALPLSTSSAVQHQENRQSVNHRAIRDEDKARPGGEKKTGGSFTYFSRCADNCRARMMISSIFSSTSVCSGFSLLRSGALQTEVTARTICCSQGSTSVASESIRGILTLLLSQILNTTLHFPLQAMAVEIQARSGLDRSLLHVLGQADLL